MTTITIHYQSPENDPFKVPRPHRLTIGTDGEPSLVTGGEIGPIGHLLGFCRDTNPGIDFLAPNFYHAKALFDGEVSPEQLTGYYAQFSEHDGSGMFGYTVKIDRIEIGGIDEGHARLRITEEP